MALTVEVTNTGDRERGRVGYVFAPGEPKVCEDIPSSRINEITDCPDLSVVVLSADSPNEVPAGVEFKVNATDAAKELARKKGIDITSVEGSGDEGRVTKDDVEKAVKAEPTDSGGGNLESSDTAGQPSVSTFSSKEEQLEAERADAERIRKADHMESDTPPLEEGDVSEPDAHVQDASSTAGPQTGDVPPEQPPGPTGTQRKEP